jgi:type IV fimbrial biogenesis protein FimT
MGIDAEYNQGFNLIELIISLSIVAILAAISGPSLASLLEKSEVKSISLLLSASLKTARNQALTNQTYVHVCAISQTDPAACDTKRDYNSNWSKGWLVFVDVNLNNDFDAADHLMSSIVNEGRSRIIFNQRGRLRFFPDGGARSAGFYLCDSEARDVIHLKILHTGRTRSLDTMSDEKKIICTQTIGA